MKKHLLASGLLTLLAVGCNVQPTNIIPANPATSSSSTNPVNANTNNPISIKSSVKTYTSTKLGVTFKYSEPDVNVKEVANKIYIYPSAMKPEEGQSVEVWTKPVSQTLTQAIQTNILTGSPAKCVIETRPSSKNPLDFQVAVITVKNVPGDDFEAYMKALEGCPENYSASNGAAYFAMDPAHPNKFMYFSIGQYPILGDKPDNDWVSTVTVQ